MFVGSIGGQEIVSDAMRDLLNKSFAQKLMDSETGDAFMEKIKNEKPNMTPEELEKAKEGMVEMFKSVFNTLGENPFDIDDEEKKKEEQYSLF